ncbi:MAG: hypothetical protein AB1Y25_10535 [Cycloclasticus sp.]
MVKRRQATACRSVGNIREDLPNRCYQRHGDGLLVDKKKNISYTFYLGV